MKQPAHLALHPFGQIPTYEEGDLALFESGAIVLHIAERHAGPAAGRRERPGARDRLDVRRAQHGRAADRRALDRHARWSATSRWYEERLPHARRSRPRPAGRAFRPARRCRLARRRVQRRRPADGDGAAPAGPARACWRSIRTSPPMSPAARRAPPTSAPSTPSTRCSRHRPVEACYMPRQESAFTWARQLPGSDKSLI